MPDTFRSYPIMEVAICLKDMPGDRIKEGDIIDVREVGKRNGIGFLEGNRILWIRMVGFSRDRNDWHNLKQSWHNEDDSIVYGKRRYCIPLDRLKIVLPSLDLNRARDRFDIYQPCCPVDIDGPFRFLDGLAMRPVQSDNLIFDKEIGDFI